MAIAGEEEVTQEARELVETVDLPQARSIFLGGIFLILLLVVMKLASEIVLPIVLAFILKLVFQPLMRAMEKLHIPRSLCALVIILGLTGMFVGIGTALSTPASVWLDRIPATLPKLQRQMASLNESLGSAKEIMNKAEGLTNGGDKEVMAVAVQGNSLSDKMFIGTTSFFSGLFTCVLILFFLLVSGDVFLRKLVEILPRFKEKRQAVDLSQQIEHNISAYLLTITVMNALVGMATAGIMMACGIPDPFLWGTIAFLLNYIPILGPFVCACLIIFVSMITTAQFSFAALLPASLYMLLHVAEGSFITPMLVARRFTLNPVLVAISIVFWYWMWGVAGAILAVPMLSIIKIICDRIPHLATFGHFLGE